MPLRERNQTPVTTGGGNVRYGWKPDVQSAATWPALRRLKTEIMLPASPPRATAVEQIANM